MFCRILSSAIYGVDAVPVAVEADASTGLPMFSIIGYVSSQVREAQDRVRTALRTFGISLPPQRLTVNLAPGDLRKDGTRFDLPIAASVLGAVGAVDPRAFSDVMIIGELRLDGCVERITGVLPSVICAKERGCRTCIVPAGNIREAQIVDGIRAVGVRDIGDLIRFAKGDDTTGRFPPEDGEAKNEAGKKEKLRAVPDFADIRGQSSMKRCALIAAAGFHNMLISGPPGAGKSMAAQRMPGILPALKPDEQLEITRLYSVAGLLPADQQLIRERPFRSPHHTVTPAALCGGGRIPHPGEVTLAHRGVLFLDELPEMKRETIELLRQPMEDHHVTISRVGGTYDYPAAFLLVAAMNPCPCGYFPDRVRCKCTPSEIGLYRRKVSHAFMDRIDLHCEVKAVSYQALTSAGRAGEFANQEDVRPETVSGHMPAEETSAGMRARVDAAFWRQADRYAGSGIHFNSELTAADMGRYCEVTEDGNRMLRSAFETLGLSARGYHHILRVARTIADLDGADVIAEPHISEAIMCRNGD